MKTTRAVNVTAFTADGQPTCATGPTVEEACIFLGTKKFGIVSVCMATGTHLRRGGPDELGYLIPCKGCVVWKEN